jgi:hypothetical protein
MGLNCWTNHEHNFIKKRKEKKRKEAANHTKNCLCISVENKLGRNQRYNDY